MKKKALIVDDNSTNLYLLKSLLEEEGFDVMTAENGQQALDQAHADPPDLIVSDILMPVMDGYTLCRQCKSSEQLRQIPFVFYTATYTEPKDEKFALSIGADRFLLKPQEPDILMKILREVLEENHAATQAAAKPLGEEMEFFRQYNEILFRKLEKKMLDLEIANQRLRTLEEQYRRSFENVTDVIYMIDADLNFISMSPSVEKLWGYQPQDFVGQPASNLRHVLAPESFQQAAADCLSILKGGIVSAKIYQISAKDGSIRYSEASGSPIIRDGKIIGMIGVSRDITDRQRAEDALRKSETKYRSILKNMYDAYFELDLKGNFVFFNDALVMQSGYSQDELMGMNYRQFISPETCQTVTRVFAEIYRTRQPVRFFDYAIITKDGQKRNYESWATLSLDNNGQPIGFRGMARDITKRKQDEEHLQETLERLRRAVSATIQVMVSAVESRDPYTAGHQVRAANLAGTIAAEMGLSEDQIEGIRTAGLVHDIGKLSVPAEILSKPTKLSKIEFSLIQEHARKGHEILKDIESSWPLAETVFQHHERMDGSGYPRHLKGEEILMEARIMAVADVVEAMASYRPYRPALGIDKALEEIEQNSGTLYDKAVTDACLRLFRERGFQFHP